jgi:hypothetical protein
MPRLTSQLLDNFPYSKYATAQTIQRGRAYYKDGRVWSTDLVNDQEATCLVDGDTGEYTVEMQMDKKSGELTFECECYYAEEGNFCKHMIAAAMELSEYLREEEYDEDDEDEFETPISKTKEPAGDWKTKLMQSVALMPRQSAGGTRLHRYAVVMLLKRHQGYFYSNTPLRYSYSLDIRVIKENEWQPLETLAEKNAQEVNALLQADKSWSKDNQGYFQSLNPKGALNVSEDAVEFINISKSALQMYSVSNPQLGGYLSMSGKLGIPLFLVSSSYPYKAERRLHIQSEPIQIQIDMQQDEKNSACNRVSTKRNLHPYPKENRSDDHESHLGSHGRHHRPNRKQPRP